MKTIKILALAGIVAIIAIAVVASFIFIEKWGQDTEEIRSAEDNIQYWTCGMHPTVKSDKEGSCPICNMALVPVYEKEIVVSKQEQVSYWTCGMHPTVKSNKSGNCPICNMALVPIYEMELKEGADERKGTAPQVKIKPEQAALAGIETQAVKKRHLFKEIRTVGKVAYDPKLAIAQEEFLLALKSQRNLKTKRANSLVASSSIKLKLLGMSEGQIKKLKSKGKIQSSLILPAKKMWIYGDVYEFELSWIRVGERVIVTTMSYPGEEFMGKIVSVNPVVDARKRTVRFRARVNNPGLRLKPEMYVDIGIQSAYRGPNKKAKVLAIPKEAVLDTGRRKIVWVDKGQGNYEGRVVRIGPEAVSVINRKAVRFYPVLEGLKEGELVVTKGNFLVDSQSRLSGGGGAASVYGGAL